MNAPEFDNLMNGKEARFADMFKSANQNTLGLAGLLAKAQSKEATPEEIEEARKEISKQEVVIPGPLRFKIDIFIQQLFNHARSTITGL